MWNCYFEQALQGKAKIFNLLFPFAYFLVQKLGD